MNLKFNVNYFETSEKDKCPMINIDTSTVKEKDSFTYSNIFGMYDTKSTQGHGIQVNDRKLESHF